jgi:O-methyltransferase
MDSASPTPNTYEPTTVANLYLDLLKGALTRSVFDENVIPVEPPRGSRKRRLYAPLEKAMSAKGLVLARRVRSEDAFAESPPRQFRDAETLIGPVGIENVRYCVEDVLRNEVPGDFIEAGVWRGGAAIFMRAMLAAHGDPTRIVWAADSFAGLPSPDESRYQEDKGADWWAAESWFAVPLDVVKRNFARYGLLDERVRFLVGWFHETLPTAPIDQLSVIRLDGDMYGSTMDGLHYLYPKLSVGGYVIVDDYWLPECRAAVDTYRAENRITDEIVRVDRAIVYWQRSG